MVRLFARCAQGGDSDTVWVSFLAADEQGRRMDSARGYLDPVLEGACAGNLQVIEGATASKVVLEGSRATGVEYSQNGATSVRGDVWAGRLFCPVLFILCSEVLKVM